MENKGSIMIIALVLVSFLGALAVSLLGPVTTVRHMSDRRYNDKQAAIIADSVAERVKYIMCRDGAIAEDGTNQCVLDCIAEGKWDPVSFEENGFADEPGKTFPYVTMTDRNGNPVFNTDTSDPDFPQFPGIGDNTFKYIVYSVEDSEGFATSYISAECNGFVKNIKISYRRQLSREFPHESYLHAVYAGNSKEDPYTFLMQGHSAVSQACRTNYRLRRDPATRGGVIFARHHNGRPQGKGHLGYYIPYANFKSAKLRIYVHNTPHGGFDVNVHPVNPYKMTQKFENADTWGKSIGTLKVTDDMKHAYVEFPLSKEIINTYKGRYLYIGFSLEAQGNKQVLFKSKGKYSPEFILEQDKGQDKISGDIFINGAADITKGSVDGTTAATDVVYGDGTGEETSAADYIPPPELSKQGEWYKSLGLSEDRRSSTNPKVVTDSSDGKIDDRIAGIICPHTQTGENQGYMDDDATSSVTYVIDSNFGKRCGPGDPTYHYYSDSTIITVPEQYNNKAIYVPGDLWCDILNPTFLDFRTPAGKPVNLTLIVEGNIYLTDGVNRKKHPKSPAGGLISFISLKNDQGKGGNILYGDPSKGGGRLDPVKAFLYAENDFKWYQKARNAGDFDIIGNMTAGEIVDLTDRKGGKDFIPINVDFDPSILDPDIRANLPCLPSPNRVDIIPGSPYEQCSLRHL